MWQSCGCMVLQKPAHSNTGNLGNCASSKTVLLSPGQRCVRVRLALKCFEMQPDIHSWCNIKSCTNPWCSVRVIGKDAVSSSKVLVGFGISLHPCTLLSLSLFCCSMRASGNYNLWMLFLTWKFMYFHTYGQNKVSWIRTKNWMPHGGTTASPC